MYRTSGRKTSSFQDLSQYVEGNDIYNSYILRKLDDPTIDKIPYLITTYEYRPDLIAKEIYGDSSYCGLLMTQCRISLSGYVRGTVLRVIPKQDLDKIIMEI